MGEILGRVMTVVGSQITISPEADLGDEGLFRIGAMVKVGSGDREVVATISAVRFENNSLSKRILSADLLGEIAPSDEGPSRFMRGVTQHPISGTPVVAATGADLTTIFAPTPRSNIRIGTLHHDVRQPAFVLVNELLRQHFAVLGTTGSGKSCAVSLLLSAILANSPMAHIILIDPHNEYGRVFGKAAELINIDPPRCRAATPARGRLHHSTKRSAAFPCCARRRATSRPAGAPSTTLHSPLIITRSAAWAPLSTSAASGSPAPEKRNSSSL